MPPDCFNLPPDCFSPPPHFFQPESDHVQWDAHHGESNVRPLQSELGGVGSVPRLFQSDQQLVGPDPRPVGLKLRRGGLKLSDVRRDFDHLQSAALLVPSDAHVFQSVTDVGRLKVGMVGSKTALVRLKKAEVASTTLGIPSTTRGRLSNVRGFQSAACRFRLAIAERPAMPRDFPSAAPRRLFAAAGDVKATLVTRAKVATVEVIIAACGQPEEKAGCLLVDGPADSVGAVTNPRPPSADPLVAPHSPRYATPRNLLARAVLHGVHRLYRH